MAMETEVIAFPNQMLCSNCVNFMCGTFGSYCGYWREDIVDEKEAQDCDGFTHY